MPFSFTKQFSLLIKSRLKSLLRQLMIVIPLKSNHQGYHLILPSNTPPPSNTHTHTHTHTYTQFMDCSNDSHTCDLWLSISVLNSCVFLNIKNLQKCLIHCLGVIASTELDFSLPLRVLRCCQKCFGLFVKVSIFFILFSFHFCFLDLGCTSSQVFDTG